MSNLKNIREKLGLNQFQVAQWLGVSKSLAQLYENGKRTLPTRALIQLAKLEMMMVDFEKRETAPMNQNGSSRVSGKGYLNTMSKIVYPHLSAHIDKTERLCKQLHLFRVKHASLQQQLTIVNHFMKSKPGEKSEKEMLWLTMIHAHTTALMARFNEAKQFALRVRIAALKLEYEMITKNNEFLNNEFPDV